METKYYLLFCIRREALERVRIKVLTNIRKEPFSNICRHNPSDDGNTSASDGFNTRRWYITRLNIRKLQLRNDLLTLVCDPQLERCDDAMNIQTPAWRQLLPSVLSKSQLGHPMTFESPPQTLWSSYASIPGNGWIMARSFCRRKLRTQRKYHPPECLHHFSAAESELRSAGVKYEVAKGDNVEFC